jgi:hypothetical protein
MGRRLALEALHAVADEMAWPGEYVELEARTVPVHPGLYRYVPSAAEAPALIALEREVELPLEAVPTATEIAAALRAGDITDATGPRASEPWQRCIVHALERTLEEYSRGEVSGTRCAPVHAVRIGDGAIVTGPGETFAEIGLAVRQRSVADMCMYAGYTNDAVGYIPTAPEHERGGYEATFAHYGYGTPAPLAPACAGILVETAMDLVSQLFPGRLALPKAPGAKAVGLG